MSVSKTSLEPNLNSFSRNLDTLYKIVLLCLGLASAGLVTVIIWNVINCVNRPQLTLAAGDQKGESYIISKAIEKVVSRKSHIKITVLSTGGTTENLKMLLEGKAELVTAQADVTADDYMGMSASGTWSEQLPAKASARTVALLYQDLFQLVHCG